MGFQYEVCGRRLCISRRCSLLGSESRVAFPVTDTNQEVPDEHPDFDQSAMVANQQRRVRYWNGPNHAQLWVNGVGRFLIDANGTWVQVIQEVGDEKLIVETLASALLVVAFALQGLFIFHGSVSQINDQAVAALGMSGSGKSTLARYLADANRSDRALADDAFALVRDNSTPSVGPWIADCRFPQLKTGALPQEGQCVPVGTVLVLDSTVRQSVVLESLTPSQAALALSKHSMATPLFSQTHLREHLAYCAEVARSLDVYCLGFPRDLRQLPNIRRKIMGVI